MRDIKQIGFFRLYILLYVAKQLKARINQNLHFYHEHKILTGIDPGPINIFYRSGYKFLAHKDKYAISLCVKKQTSCGEKPRILSWYYLMTEQQLGKRLSWHWFHTFNRCLLHYFLNLRHVKFNKQLLENLLSDSRCVDNYWWECSTIKVFISWAEYITTVCFFGQVVCHTKLVVFRTHHPYRLHNLFLNINEKNKRIVTKIQKINFTVKNGWNKQ